jgi:hypothetical protein
MPGIVRSYLGPPVGNNGANREVPGARTPSLPPMHLALSSEALVRARAVPWLCVRNGTPGFFLTLTLVLGLDLQRMGVRQEVPANADTPIH